jgi:hypothetical protein
MILGGFLSRNSRQEKSRNSQGDEMEKQTNKQKTLSTKMLYPEILSSEVKEIKIFLGKYILRELITTKPIL